MTCLDVNLPVDVWRLVCDVASASDAPHDDISWRRRRRFVQVAAFACACRTFCAAARLDADRYKREHNQSLDALAARRLWRYVKSDAFVVDTSCTVTVCAHNGSWLYTLLEIDVSPVTRERRFHVSVDSRRVSFMPNAAPDTIDEWAVRSRAARLFTTDPNEIVWTTRRGRQQETRPSEFCDNADATRRLIACLCDATDGCLRNDDTVWFKSDDISCLSWRQLMDEERVYVDDDS